MRQERRTEYARIITLSRAAVTACDKGMTAARSLGPDNEFAVLVMDGAAEARQSWRDAWAEVDLVASNEINGLLADLDALLRRYEDALATMVFDQWDLDTGDEQRKTVLLLKDGGPPLADGVRLIEQLVDAARRELGAVASGVAPAAGDGAGGAARKAGGDGAGEAGTVDPVEADSAAMNRRR